MLKTIAAASAFSREQLHEAALDAFSDYDIEMQPTIEQFGAMLNHRHYDHKLSFVALSDGKIASFWLVGRDRENAYLIMSGTRPPARKQGLADELAQQSEALQRANGIKQFQFEVLTSNTRAISFYEKQGYKRTEHLIVTA